MLENKARATRAKLELLEPGSSTRPALVTRSLRGHRRCRYHMINWDRCVNSDRPRRTAICVFSRREVVVSHLFVGRPAQDGQQQRTRRCPSESQFDDRDLGEQVRLWLYEPKQSTMSSKSHIQERGIDLHVR